MMDVLQYVAAGVFAVSALTLLYNAHKKAQQLSLIAIYLLLTSISFAVPEPFKTIIVALAAASIISFVIHLELNSKRFWSAICSILIIALSSYGIISNLPIAQAIALLLVTLSSFYILYAGTSTRKHSLVIGNLLFLTGIVAHLPPLLELKTYEIQLGVALLSSLSILLALYIGKHLE